jgi:nitroreductase
MEFFDVISTRRSFRKYTEQDVSEAMIDTIIRAGMMAPSAGNQQPWHFIVTRDHDKMAKVQEFHPYASMLKSAPVAIVVCGDPSQKKWPDFWPQDCSAALQNMLLAARDIGLGTVWVGVYPLKDRMEGMRKLFGIPAEIYPFAIVPVGWPNTEFKSMDRYNGSLIHSENWKSTGRT